MEICFTILLLSIILIGYMICPYFDKILINRRFDRDTKNGTLRFYVAINKKYHTQPLWAKNEEEVWKRYSDLEVIEVYESTEDEYFRCWCSEELPKRKSIN